MAYFLIGDDILSSTYIKATWSRYFEIVSYLPSHHGYQSVVVLRKA